MAKVQVRQLKTAFIMQNWGVLVRKSKFPENLTFWLMDGKKNKRNKGLFIYKYLASYNNVTLLRIMQYYKYRYIIMTMVMIIISSDAFTRCNSNRWINKSVFGILRRTMITVRYQQALPNTFVCSLFLFFVLQLMRIRRSSSITVISPG